MYNPQYTENSDRLALDQSVNNGSKKRKNEHYGEHKQKKKKSEKLPIDGMDGGKSKVRNSLRRKKKKRQSSQFITNLSDGDEDDKCELSPEITKLRNKKRERAEQELLSQTSQSIVDQSAVYIDRDIVEDGITSQSMDGHMPLCVRYRIMNNKHNAELQRKLPPS